MNTINTLDYHQQGRKRPNMVLKSLKAVFKYKKNASTLIIADYDKKLIRNTIA